MYSFEIVDEVDKQEYIQSHIRCKKPLKLALKSCYWRDKNSMKYFLNIFSNSFVFYLSAGDLGAHE